MERADRFSIGCGRVRPVNHSSGSPLTCPCGGHMARKSVSKEILIIRRSFAQLAVAFARMGPALDAALKNGDNGGHRPASASTRRKMTITPKRRAALKLQGRYMGMMRGMKPRQA